jgi:hypothetical protein
MNADMYPFCAVGKINAVVVCRCVVGGVVSKWVDSREHSKR